MCVHERLDAGDRQLQAACFVCKTGTILDLFAVVVHKEYRLVSCGQASQAKPLLHRAFIACMQYKCLYPPT